MLVPGSCSTGAAWRPIIEEWGGRFRTVTTSLLGYGGTAERRTPGDTSILHEADIVEAVLRRAGRGVHLVGHSFGGLVALAVAIRGHAELASLTIEAPAAGLLRVNGEHQHYRAFRAMSDAYHAAFAGGNAEAIAVMIDFYGGGWVRSPPGRRGFAPTPSKRRRPTFSIGPAHTTSRRAGRRLPRSTDLPSCSAAARAIPPSNAPTSS